MEKPASDIEPPARLGKVMTYLAWALALGLLTLAFNHWLEAEKNPNQKVKSVFLEGSPAVTLERNRYGHYHARGQINGQDVEFLLDTGATEVSVPAVVAHRLGLHQGVEMPVNTANGTLIVYATRLGRVQLGNIVLDNVKAHINPGIKTDEVLLGMSFLKQLEFSQRGNTLTLIQPKQ